MLVYSLLLYCSSGLNEIYLNTKQRYNAKAMRAQRSLEAYMQLYCVSALPTALAPAEKWWDWPQSFGTRRTGAADQSR